jgi:hypothetical protein
MLSGEPPKVVPLTYVVRRVQYAKIRGAASAEAALRIAEHLDDEQVWTVGEYELFTEYEEQP